MIIRYAEAGLAGLLLSGIINIDYIKTDLPPVYRVTSSIVNSVIMPGLCLIFVHYYGFTYRFIVYSLLAVNLLYISNYDIREQNVSLESITVSVLGALAALVWNRDNAWWFYILSGIAYGIVFLLASRITRGALGPGDALIIGTIGLYLGFLHTLTVVFYALFLGGIISLILFIMRKVSRQTPLPFAPFLTAGFIVSILL